MSIHFPLISSSQIEPNEIRQNVSQEQLKTTLEHSFSDETSQWEQLHLFSNENGHESTLNHLSQLQSSISQGKMAVGLQTGEAFINSCLPEWSKHCNLIIMNDLDHRVTEFTRFLISVLKDSTSPEDFLRRFAINTPVSYDFFFQDSDIELSPTDVFDASGNLVDCDNPNSFCYWMRSITIKLPNGEKEKIYFRKNGHTNWVPIVYKAVEANYRYKCYEIPGGLTDEQRQNILKDYFMEQQKSVGKKHFLSSDERFNECREAARLLTFIFTNIDLFDSDKMKQLAKSLREYSAEITIMNMSNLHQYDKANVLSERLSALPLAQKHSILFSGDGPMLSRFDPLCSHVASDLYEYTHHKAMSKSKQ